MVSPTLSDVLDLELSQGLLWMAPGQALERALDHRCII